MGSLQSIKMELFEHTDQKLFLVQAVQVVGPFLQGYILLGLLQKRVDVSSVHIRFSNGEEAVFTPKEEDIIYLTETVQYHSLGDKPTREWIIKWIEKEKQLGDFYPEGVQVIPKNYRGNILDFWEKIVLHSTESTRYLPSTENYFGHQLWPHATLAPHLMDGKWTIFNHLPLTRTGAAMRNQAGGVQTNNDGCIQIEIVLKAAEGPDLPQEALDVLASWIKWVCKETGIPLFFVDDFHFYPPEDGWRLGKEPWRLRGQFWNNFRGILGHQHADENVHGDPGKINIPYLRAKLLDNPPTGKEEEIMVTYFCKVKGGNALYIIPGDWSRAILVSTLEDWETLSQSTYKKINLGEVSQSFLDALNKEV